MSCPIREAWDSRSGKSSSRWQRQPTQLNNQELRVRNAALNARRLEREDETWKSYGILKYARRITEKDARIFVPAYGGERKTGVISFEKEKLIQPDDRHQTGQSGVIGQSASG